MSEHVVTFTDGPLEGELPMTGPFLPDKLSFPTGTIVAHNKDSVSLIRQDPHHAKRPDGWQEY